jgi:uncharacterized protein YdaT
MIRSRSFWDEGGDFVDEGKRRMKTTRTTGMAVGLIIPVAALKATQTLAKEGKNEIKAALERKKQEFTKLARRLNEKKLELADAENQYQSEAR